MRHLKYFILAAVVAIFATSCNNWLETDSSYERIVTDEQVFKDPALMDATLANLHDRAQGWDRIMSTGVYEEIDEAIGSGHGTDDRQVMDRNAARTDWTNSYGFIRDCNILIKGVRTTTAISADKKKEFEAEVRYLRAYSYFIVAKTLGGAVLIGDTVYQYKANDDLSKYPIPRNTETETWDYIVNELEASARLFDDDVVRAGSHICKWSALGLKARAALYAGSIAKHTAGLAGDVDVSPDQLRTSGGEAGIPLSEANRFYATALTAAEEVIASGKYTLMTIAPGSTVAQYSRNFYEVTSKKAGNTEMMACFDRATPDLKTGFTRDVLPNVLVLDGEGAGSSPTLNVVEGFQFIDGTPAAPIVTTVDGGGYKFYNNLTEVFAGRDPRLYGSVTLPESTLKIGTEAVIDMQTGAYIWNTTKPTPAYDKISSNQQNNFVDLTPYGYPAGTKPAQVTTMNGPFKDNGDIARNKSGFFYRKFMDEATGSNVGVTLSAMWNLRMRYAEMYLIAAEAMIQSPATSTLGHDAAWYINQIRNRAGMPSLPGAATFADLQYEQFAEFSFEEHRFWDQRRWRTAHKTWNGTAASTKNVAFYYKVYNSVNPAENGKWIIDRVPSDRVRFARKFDIAGYYGEMDQDWINRNPKLVKNPLQ